MTPIQMEPSNRHTQITTYLQNEEVEDLLYEFLRDRTPLTEKAYREDLKRFFAFTNKHFGLPRIDGNKFRFDEIKRVHIVKYKNFLESHNSARGKPYAPNSIHRRISAISSFYHFLAQRDIVGKNPAALCVRPKRIVIHETQAFSDREMKNLFDLVIAEAHPLHKAIILTLFTSGIRNAEIRNLKLSNFKIREGMRFLKYMGKGQKVNEIPVHPTASHHIDEYVAWMEKKGRKIEPDDYLFQPTKNSLDGTLKKKLSHTAIGYIVGKWAKKINPEKRITPHSGRAYAKKFIM